jgi:hypothetical protein
MKGKKLPAMNVRGTIESAEPAHDLTRRTALCRAFFGLLCGSIGGSLLEFFPEGAEGSPINPNETTVILPGDIQWTAWTGLPPHIGEMASLFGGLNESGPYVVFMKWYPGYMSAPHTYATDRLSVVISGTWWVNSGEDFTPEDCAPVPAGGFVRRVAHTPHYDGVKRHARQPAIIAIFGMGPVELRLVDPSKPGWRKL